MKSCSFFGGEDLKINKKVRETLFTECERLVVLGYATFYFGGLGNFDRACYRAVSRIRDSKQNINRVYCRFFQGDTKDRAGYEESVCFPTEPNAWYTRIFHRNYQTLLHTDLAVFCFKDYGGNDGAETLFRIALELNKPCINLYERLIDK